MKRRDRFSGVAWLNGFPDLQDVGMQSLQGRARSDPLYQLIAQLTGYGYLIEIEQVAANYRVRLLPVVDTLVIGQPAVGLSYTGASLRAIVIAALYEVELLGKRETLFQPSSMEVVRWVP